MQSSVIYNITFIAAVAPHSKSPHAVLISTSLARCRKTSITAWTRMWGALPLFYHFHKQTFPTRFRETPDPPICKSRTRLQGSRLSSILTNIYFSRRGTPLDHYCTLSAELVTIIVYVHFIEYLLTRLNLEVIFGACLESN